MPRRVCGVRLTTQTRKASSREVHRGTGGSYYPRRQREGRRWRSASSVARGIRACWHDPCHSFDRRLEVMSPTRRKSCNAHRRCHRTRGS